MGELKQQNLARKPHRYPVEMTATFRLKGRSEKHPAQMVNLSTGGLCAQISIDLELHQIVEFFIDTVGKDEKKTERRVLARVMWQDQSKYGFQFLKAAK